ncbi:MAG: glycosyltransferase family 2 protein [Gemmatimonadetes bacterium]|nr:glycosyltransferase family 2 protein [Gemmatimonadota bacterium]MBT8404129.1 glycosyltransferase family 2 protein [Gemmatimonadota bacterium]NNF37061.1 glycosyltransferase family 2 protein [Gemmatimonadota bacterium]NNK62716.1 glycosyltransferase family 2 protein [Gemmatimonadota bacterium]
MSAPRVTCIIPVYDGERFLAASIESVLAQSRPVDEIIVVDDGSTDGSADVARSFGDAVVYVYQENAGPAAARNRGLAAASGDFISFCDADDLWEPRKLEQQLLRFAERPELGYVVGHVQNFWEEEVAEERERMANHMRARPIPGYVTLALLARREWFERAGGFDEDLGHGDAADWFRRADAAGAVSELSDDVIARRRLHGQNRSRTMASSSRTEFLTMLKRKLDRERAAGAAGGGGPAGAAPAGASPKSAPSGRGATADGAEHPLDFRHTAREGLISCIVPVFNGEAFVAEALDSILRQSGVDTEVIVVDDGSTDGTPEVLDGFGDRIRVIRQENAGPAAARNRGLAESRGEFVAFLDADDIWVDDKLASQLAVLREQEDVEICSGHLRSFWVPELDHEREELENEPYHQERAMLSPCTILTRRAVFERVGGFDVSLRNGEDTDWFVRALRSEVKAHTIPRLLVHRRQHTENLTRRTPPSQLGLIDHIKRALDRERAP